MPITNKNDVDMSKPSDCGLENMDPDALEARLFAELIQLLIAAGADADTMSFGGSSEGLTPLMASIGRNTAAIAKVVKQLDKNTAILDKKVRNIDQRLDKTAKQNQQMMLLPLLMQEPRTPTKIEFDATDTSKVTKVEYEESDNTLPLILMMSGGLGGGDGDQGNMLMILALTGAFDSKKS